MALIFIMVDGVGLAPAGPTNPVVAHTPQLARFLDAPLTDALNIATPTLLARPIDATLGVSGLPQSGSGHTAIYGGFNAAAFNGRHQPSYPTVPMRERLAQQNIFRAARHAGCRVAWANAYLPGYMQAVAQRKTRHTAGTWAALHAGLELRGVAELRADTALSWDITRRMARTRPLVDDLRLITAEQAGAQLAALARSHDLVAFETYLPDLAGHGRIPWTVEEAITTVDGLLQGVIAAKQHADTLIVTSDHGNSEDITTRVHTRNRVPLLAIGPAAAQFAAITAIDQIAAAMLEVLGHSYHADL